MKIKYRRSQDLSSLAITLSLCILLGLASWATISRVVLAYTPSYQIAWPKDEALEIPFTLSIEYKENLYAKEAWAKSYQIEGSLLATPKERYQAVLYTLRLNQFKVRDVKDRLLMGFTREEGPRYHYQTDPSLSPYERAALYQAFQINTEILDPFQDHSLFQESIQVSLGPKGNIRSTTLSPRLKNLINERIRPLHKAPFLMALLGGLDRLPSLLPKERLPKSWTSQGQLEGPILLKHQLGAQGAILSRFETEDTLLEFQWRFDKKSGQVHAEKLLIKSVSHQKLLGNPAYSSLNIKLQLH